ncbi:DinB family protein [Alicyclobacillus acidocaldarius]|uniref:DinB family protein n=1 Tax=Alicyclobacillus acidocaldarius (strain Tc-4-1) TaxID=1048834 RepID=F8IJR2_ALIAT|nr:DinB family protein [Alicyclobacillus acidocaldarius]AEJ42251.1 DinB family protein [Alicyclobacillus acidocaldarius subsp. acidocaldarius Tc-4-1]
MSKVESVLTHWHSHRDVLAPLVDSVPEDKLDFKPWDGAMSFRDLVWHILSTGAWFAAAAKTGRITNQPERPDLSTKQAILQAISSLTDRTHADVASVSDEQLESLVDTKAVFGADLPVNVLLSSMIDHEVHHKGQLFVYARIMGAEKLPFFVHRG